MAIVNGLTTLANAKMICGIPSANTTYDATIELLINRISGQIRNYLGRDLARGTYTEKLPATARQFLIVQQYPIVSVTSIYSRDKLLTLNTDYRLDAQDAAAGMIYKEDGWAPVSLVSGMTMDVMAAARTIDVIYVAGFYLPADVTTAPADPHYVAGAATALPLEIQGVVDEMIAASLTRIKLQAQGLSSYSEGGISYGWRATGAGNSTMMGISDEHAFVLNQFKRFVAA